MRSLLPGSKIPPYAPFVDIQGPRNINLTTLPKEVLEQVTKLELGQIPVPVIKVSQNYVLIDEPENIQAWLLCKVACISAVYLKIVKDGTEVLLSRTRAPQVTSRYFDENQLDLAPEVRENLPEEHEVPPEEEEEENFYEEGELLDDPIDEQP